MDFGFSLPGRGPLATPDVLIKLARKADDLRYSSLFVTDHVVIPATQTTPYPYAPTGKFAGDWTNGYLEPLALMSFLAGETSRVRLGTSVLVIPYRNPVVTAKMLATLDVLSGGRVILGAGVGWFKEEFEALHAEPFERRGPTTDEYIALMRACWTREPVDWQGPIYRMGPVSAMPKPKQKGGIPVWTGGHTDVALRRAGELSDGWHPSVCGLPPCFSRKSSGTRWPSSTTGPRRPAAIPRPSPCPSAARSRSCPSAQSRGAGIARSSGAPRPK